MTTSKETKLVRGGGGGHPGTPLWGETLGTDWYRRMRRGVNVVEEWRMYQKESLGCVYPVTSRFLRSNVCFIAPLLSTLQRKYVDNFVLRGNHWMKSEPAMTWGSTEIVQLL